MTVRPQTEMAAEPSATPLPAIPDRSASSRPEHGSSGASTGSKPEEPFPLPKLRLELRDLTHPGTAKFLRSVDATTLLPAAVADVQRLLYRAPSDPHTSMPPTRSVTLVLRAMDGVAYTTGVQPHPFPPLLVSSDL